MKFLVPALLLSSAIASFCQTTPQRPLNPDQIFQMSKQFQLARPNFSKAMSYQTLSQVMSVPPVIRTREAPQLGDPRLDAQIIHRPPLESFAAQQSLPTPAGDLYPNLKLLPVETARLDAIPPKSLSPHPGHAPNKRP